MSVPNIFAAVNTATGSQLDANFTACAQLNANNAFTGTNTAATQSPGDNSNNLATTAYVATAVSGTTVSPKIPSITAVSSGSAITVSLATQQYLDFRSATSGSGAVTTILCPTNSLLIRTSDTLGTVSTQAAQIQVVELYNAGTPVIGVVNGTIDETIPYASASVPLSGAACVTAGQIYTATGVTVAGGSPVRVIGQFTATITGANWGSCSPVSGVILGQNSLGYGQTWQVLTVGTTRVAGTTYYNTTGKPIVVSISTSSGTSGGCNITVNGVLAARAFDNSGQVGTFTSAVIPPGASYVCALTGSGGSFYNWSELS
jgi:hypothetical protein